jgi:hypothetical protein
LPEANRAEGNSGEARCAARLIPEPHLEFTASLGMFLGDVLHGAFKSIALYRLSHDGKGVHYTFAIILV